VAESGDLDHGIILLGAAAAVPGAPQGERLSVEVTSAAAAEVGTDSDALWRDGRSLDVEAALELAVTTLVGMEGVPS
jgi:hypothetical protein